MKKCIKIIISALFLLMIYMICNNSSSSNIQGKYQQEDDSSNYIMIMDKNSWASVTGHGGDYTLNGNGIILKDSLTGASQSGILMGNTIVILQQEKNIRFTKQ